MYACIYMYIDVYTYIYISLYIYTRVCAYMYVYCDTFAMALAMVVVWSHSNKLDA